MKQTISTLEKVEFKARIYTLEGKSMMCPDNTIKVGDKVIAAIPMKQIDPRNMYAFVCDGTETQSVSRRFLKPGAVVKLHFMRPRYATHNQEVALKIATMNEYLKLIK